MADLDAAIGYVVAHGDFVDRARLSWLRSGISPPQDVFDKVELGQTREGGWPALWADAVASVDATCFRLAELDDLGALERPAAQRALEWLSAKQRPDGTWEEDESLAEAAPSWAQPGDPEARLYLTTNAAFWLAVTSSRHAADDPRATLVVRAAEAFRAALRPDGTWPSFLAAGWLGGALLYRLGWFYEAAQIQVVLSERLSTMSSADTAWLAATLRRVGMSNDDWVVQSAKRRLSETQRGDGSWESDDGPAFNVHTTLAAIRALR
jgi:hypothetical protein